MINYLKMKRNEWKVKAYFYEKILHMINNQKDIIATLEKLFASLKDEESSNHTQANEYSE